MDFQQFRNLDSQLEMRSSAEMIRSLANSALHETTLSEAGNSQELAGIKNHLQMILAYTSRIFALLGEGQPSTALVRSEKPVPTAYRLTEDSNSSLITETSLVVSRPSLLQLVTDSVPAIDLDNRQRLMHSIVEMIRQTEDIVPDGSNTAIQPSQPTTSSLVTIVEPPIISDAHTLRHLFQPKKLLTVPHAQQADWQPVKIAVVETQ